MAAAPVGLGGAVCALVAGDAVSALALGDAVSALAFGDAVPAGALEAEVPALVLGAAVSVPVAGWAPEADVVPFVVLAVTDVSEEVDGDSSRDAGAEASTALLFDLALAGFGAFFGMLSVSMLATLEDGTRAAGFGATSGCEPASATTVEGAWLVADALASFAGVGAGDAACGLATAAGAAMTFASMRWLNASAPAITIAMIKPNAMGKCFIEASWWDGQSPSDTGGASRLRA